MAFRETSRLLPYEDLPESIPKSVVQWKKCTLPLMLLIPLLILYGLLQYISVLRSNDDAEVADTNTSLLTSPSISSELIYNPPIPPISQLMSNGSVRVERFHLTLTKGDISPDGRVRKQVHLVNGKYPGPILRVHQKSIMILTVKNQLDIPVTIHLHGIHQRGSFLSDGVPFVTQEPIQPGQSFTHTVNTWPQAGTFFYHAHTGMDIVWIAAPLLVLDDPEVYSKYPSEYQYDEDRVVLINGIYYRQTLETLITELTGDLFFNYPRIDSVIINGKGHGLDPVPPRFSDEANDTSIEQTPSSIDLDVTAVKAKKRYRFRFINAISDGTFSCNVPRHIFTIIEMDGIYTEPIVTDSLVISPGQRYSFIVETDQIVDNYFLICKHLEIKGPTGLSVIRYASSSRNSTSRSSKSSNGKETRGSDYYKDPSAKVLLNVINKTLDEVVEDKKSELFWVLDELQPNFSLNQTDVYPVPENVDKEFYLDVEEVAMGQRNVYLVNGHFFQEPNISYYRQLSEQINITSEPQVFEIEEGDVVQIIFQNQRFQSRECFGHPWHIHGHSFHVVAHGPDKYDPILDRMKINENVRLNKKMQFRDTVMLNADQTAPPPATPRYCGWTAVRFIANNPGIWLAHCHVTPHMLMGKRFVLWEHSTKDPFLIQLSKDQLPN